MTIKTGDRLPGATFTTMTAEGPSQLSTDNIFAGRKVVLFAVPGAFTPTCHREHLPGYIENIDALKAKGVDTVACVSVNDVFVMDAWGKQLGADGKVMMLADGNGDFAKAIGLDLDGSGLGMGIRSKRYAMIVNDGTVEMLAIESAPGQAVDSGARAVLAAL